MKSVLRFAVAVAFAVSLGAAQANATIANYVVPLNGANEVLPNVGDPDGSGTAFLTLNDVTNTIDWNIVTLNIGAPIAAHIHIGAAGVNGPVRIDFSGALVGSGLVDPDVALVVANPLGWYVNVHTAAHPGGAIRGQVPEPTTGLLLGAGLIGLAVSRRRRAS